MVKIENNKECFVQLWLLLERTRRMLGAQYKRFCQVPVPPGMSPLADYLFVRLM